MKWLCGSEGIGQTWVRREGRNSLKRFIWPSWSGANYSRLSPWLPQLIVLKLWKKAGEGQTSPFEGETIPTLMAIDARQAKTIEWNRVDKGVDWPASINISKFFRKRIQHLDRPATHNLVAWSGRANSVTKTI